MSILSASELKQFQAKGWEITKTNDKKVRYRHEQSGTQFFAPERCHSGRAEKNLRAALRRPLRELENRPTGKQSLQPQSSETPQAAPAFVLPPRRYPVSRAESEQNTATQYWTQDGEIDRPTAVAAWCLCYLGLRAGSHPIPAINAARDRFRFDPGYRARVVETFLKMDDADFQALRARNRERFAGAQTPPVLELRAIEPQAPREPQRPLSLPRSPGSAAQIATRPAALPAVAPTPPGIRAELVKLSEGLEHERRMRRVSGQTQAELQRKIERALSRVETLEARMQHWQEEVEERIQNMSARLAEPVRQVVPPPAAPVPAAPVAPVAPVAEPAAAAPEPTAEPAPALAAYAQQARNGETVGEKLLRARGARRMTQNEAGKFFGVAGVTYLFWEKDRNPVPEHRQDKLDLFLSVLGEPGEPAEDRVAVKLPGRTIGDRIRIRRTELGLSQGEVGEQIGKTGNAVSHWEAGRANPKKDTLEPLAVVLHTTERALLGPKG